MGGMAWIPAPRPLLRTESALELMPRLACGDFRQAMGIWTLLSSPLLYMASSTTTLMATGGLAPQSTSAPSGRSSSR